MKASAGGCTPILTISTRFRQLYISKAANIAKLKGTEAQALQISRMVPTRTSGLEPPK